jgi:dihydropyrimidinase
MVKHFLEEGKIEPRWHPRSRPSIAEGEATGRAITLAGVVGCPLYIVHLTCREALEKVVTARTAGQAVYAETCPQYLLLDDTVYDEPDFGGAKYVMSPPIRPKGHQDVLWGGLRSGQIQVVATDHAPFNFKGQKEMGRESFAKIPNGAPILEHRLELLYSYGVGGGRIDLHRFVDAVATAPARIYGLFPRKGTIAVGSDADLVIWNPEEKRTISAATHHMRVDYSTFEGFAIHGVAETVVAGGRIVCVDGNYVGEAGRGQYLKR